VTPGMGWVGRVWFCSVLAIALALTVPARSARAAGSGAKSVAPGEAVPLTPSEVRQLKDKLRDLGFWVGPAGPNWDEVSRQALVAFQKAEWRKPTGRLVRAELTEALHGFAPAARERGPAHLEVDLARQILFLVDADGSVSHILPISSGSGRLFHAPAGWSATADTPCGHFTVFAKAAGWQHSPLGEMLNPLYIVGGIAIHGSESVPARPVSHGCIRIPIPASAALYHLVPRNTPVVVYGCTGEEPAPLPAVATAAAAAADTHQQ
jgi:N-acetylmuramoyl-L-alanine amidase